MSGIPAVPNLIGGRDVAAVFTDQMTWADAQHRMTARFTEANIATPAVDARALLRGILQVDGVRLLADPDTPVGQHAAALERAVQRRCAREPVSRILGWREFYGRRFDLSPATLDPRPDSETVIDAILAMVRERGWYERPLRIIDVGTGSGCLLVTLLAELPYARGLATDISEAALMMAGQNAERNNVAGRMDCRLADLLDDIEDTFDLLVTNPPYIASGAINQLEPEVKWHDPIASLDGGVDGLQLYERLIARLSLVVPDGYAFFEIGYDQAEQVTQLLRNAGALDGWPQAHAYRDLAGQPRCVAQKTLSRQPDK